MLSGVSLVARPHPTLAPAEREARGDAISCRRRWRTTSGARCPRRMPAHPERSRWGGAALVALVTAVLVLPSLGQRYVGTTDEARFILYAREAIAQKSLFDVRLRGKF